jgi:hypothetical protein
MHASGYKYGLQPDFEFGKALRQFPNMIADTLYWKLIGVYRQKVPDSQIHVLFLEDLERDPEQAYHSCLDFLGVCRHPLEPQPRRLNTAASKRRDTRLLRWIQTSRITSGLWSRLSRRQQELVLSHSRLRVPFDLDIVWDQYSQEQFARVVQPDASQFLAHYGKPADFWKFNFQPEHRLKHAA